jgi:hypothetical protein
MYLSGLRSRICGRNTEAEFLERHSDSVADFGSHLSAEPEHCISRSVILATTLLSVGVAGRMAFVVSRYGHSQAWCGNVTGKGRRADSAHFIKIENLPQHISDFSRTATQWLTTLLHLLPRCSAFSCNARTLFSMAPTASGDMLSRYSRRLPRVCEIPSLCRAIATPASLQFSRIVQPLSVLPIHSKGNATCRGTIVATDIGCRR